MEAKRRVLLPNPGVRASLWSILTFNWSYNMITKAFRKILFVRDLWQPLPQDRSRELANNLEDLWCDVNSEGCRFRLPRALIRTNRFDYCNTAFLMVAYTICIRVIAPLILRPTSLYFIEGNEDQFDYAVHCATGFFLMAMSVTLISNHVSHSCFYAGLRMQTALWSLIYKKTLRLPTTSMDKASVKIIQESFTRDPSKLDVMSLYMLYLWTAPFILLVIASVMCVEIGWAAIPGIAVIILMVPARNVLNVFCYNCLGRLGEKTKERYLKTKEVIENIEIVKKHAWIKDLNRIILNLRQKEMNILRCSIFQHAFHMVLMIFTSRIALVATIVSVVFIEGKVSPINAFVYFFYFDILTIIITQIFTRAFSQSRESYTYLKEVEKFLDMDEIPLKAKQEQKKKKKDGEENYPVLLKNVRSTWNYLDTRAFTLTKLNLKLQKGTLVCVVGPPKCGKTSLLHTILQDMHITGGSIVTNEPFGYAPQVPWIFSSTIRQNILFGSTMNKEKYEKVIKSCALLPDLSAIPSGDLTILKEDEINLFENQKIRINVARAAYRNAEVYLFDDILSGLPSSMARYVFDRTIGPRGLLKKSLRILVTNNMQYIKQANLVIVMDEKNGIDEQVLPRSLNVEKYDYLEHVDESAIIHDEKEEEEYYCSKKYKGIKPVDRHYDNEMDSEDIEDFEGDGFFDVDYSSGRYNSFIRYITEGAGFCTIVALSLAFIFLYGIIASSDLWLTFWVTLEITKPNVTVLCGNITNCSLTKASQKYIQHSNIFYEIYDHAKEVFEDQTKYIGLPETAPCFLVYLVFIAITFSLAIIINLFFSRICLKSNKRLHDMLLNKMTSARISFYQRTRNSKILRLFDVDMKVVDKVVPASLLESINLFLWITGWALTTLYANANLSIFLMIILIVFFIAQYRLLITTKRLKQLQTSMRTKLSMNFNATLQHICMIRAFKIENQVQQDFDNLLDVHSSTKSTFLSTTTAFSLILETLSMSSIAVLLYLLFNGIIEINGHLLTFTIMQLVGFTGMLGWSLKQTASSSSELTSVERIFKYCNVQQEVNVPNPQRVRKTWPECGRIVFRDMSLGYYESSEDAINNVTFNFSAREKVAIVGQSGSGKTSFVNAILRMGLLKGIVEIDRTDISQITLEDIRSRITTITRKPAIFSGTIRSNVDLNCEHCYNDIMYALKAVQLDMLDPNMLVDHNGENLTLKQRHLLAFARAVLRNNRIIILDEPMANMDSETVQIVENVITEYLGESTIFHITDLLEHVMFSDCVFVIEDGVVREKGLPYKLLQKNDGEFCRMVRTYKKVDPAKLIEIANLKVERYPYLKIE